MNLVDSSGWLEYFTGGKNAHIFAPIIENTEKLLVSVINLYEIYKKVLIEKNEYSAMEALSVMQQAMVIDINPSISIEAARLGYKLKIPMADSLIYASARLNDAVLWTQDTDFKGLEGVKFIKK
jgi:predicted nucleic acid-binding protein